jgi:hypothetical protein
MVKQKFYKFHFLNFEDEDRKIKYSELYGSKYFPNLIMPHPKCLNLSYLVLQESYNVGSSSSMTS